MLFSFVAFSVSLVFVFKVCASDVFSGVSRMDFCFLLFKFVFLLYLLAWINSISVQLPMFIFILGVFLSWVQTKLHVFCSYARP